VGVIIPDVCDRRCTPSERTVLPAAQMPRKRMARCTATRPLAAAPVSAIMAADSGRGGETGIECAILGQNPQIGERLKDRLKIPGLPKGRAGSIPAPGTTKFNHNKHLAVQPVSAREPP
jgi:hypothetical protein